MLPLFLGDPHACATTQRVSDRTRERLIQFFCMFVSIQHHYKQLYLIHISMLLICLLTDIIKLNQATLLTAQLSTSNVHWPCDASDVKTDSNLKINVHTDYTGLQLPAPLFISAKKEKKIMYTWTTDIDISEIIE